MTSGKNEPKPVDIPPAEWDNDLSLLQRGMGMRKQHIFFDLDGTLTDSMPGITRAVQYALRHYGILIEDLNVLKPFVGPPLHESFMQYYGFPEPKAREAVLVFREYYNDIGWTQNEPYEGVREMLEGLLADGRTLYIATSKPEGIAGRVLDRFSLTKYFKFIGAAKEDNTRIRKNDVIDYVVESCGLEDRNEIVMVGDRSHDIAGAHKAGIEAIGVLYGYGSREELSGAEPEWITETPRTLMELVKSL